MVYYVHCIRYHMCSQSHRDGYDVKEYAAGEPIPLGQTHSSPNPRNSWTSSMQGPFNTRAEAEARAAECRAESLKESQRGRKPATR